jgi:formylmethanofuran dehydrogenase subunit E
MDEEWEFETDEEPEEVSEEAEIVGFADSALFGDPPTGPTFYHCDQCGEDILTQDVAWDRNDQPHCPECEGLLTRSPTSGAATA